MPKPIGLSQPPPLAPSVETGRPGPCGQYEARQNHSHVGGSLRPGATQGRIEVPKETCDIMCLLNASEGRDYPDSVTCTDAALHPDTTVTVLGELRTDSY